MKWKVPYSGISNRLGAEETEAIIHALQQDTLTSGPLATQFEDAFARYLGAKHAVATSSCTTALYLSVQALGLREGDEVIATPQTFWSALFPLVARRCIVRFADIDPNSLNIDPAKIEPLLTPRTRAIYVVHHGGQAVDLDPILSLARARQIRVVEDCAHAPGATYKGKYLGTLGDIGCFSFHSLKNMTAGEGGMLVTNDSGLFERARTLGRIGTVGELVDRAEARLGEYAEPTYHRATHARNAYRQDFANDRFEIGNNYRMSELHAALGLAQLRKLDALNERRRDIARRITAGLRNLSGISVQEEQSFARHIYHLYTFFYHPEVVGVAKDDFIRYLEREEGIQIVLRYFPVHLLPELRVFGHGVGECPIAERVFFEQQIQLPIYDHLTDKQIDHMIQGVRRAVEQLGRYR